MSDSERDNRPESDTNHSETPSGILDQIIADFLDAESEGEPFDEEELIQRHPEFAKPLRQFLADHKRMGGLLDSGASDDATLPPSKTKGVGQEPTLGDLDSIGDLAARHNIDPDQCIADYLLVDKIAEGGMGVVYRAKQLSLNRTVALKMIRAGEFADVEEIRRFRVEAEAAAKLTHPNIVPIYQIGEDKGQHFFSMALVEGHSLADMIREQPMKPRRAAEYVAKVAQAVHYAHQQGIIHRDIKPANVLVDTNDEPKVTDFGLAKQITSDHELTMSGQILGTASYMSPEQAAGKEVTPLADVYSLGSLLYALLTQKPPFTGANPVDILLDVLSKDPATPSSLNITISRDLETICMRCLEKDPKQRYASAAEVGDDLNRFLDGRPIHARPVGRVEKYLRWCKRRPAAAATIVLSFLLCLSVGAYYGKAAFVKRDVIEDPRDKTRKPSSLLVQARNHYAKNLPAATTTLDELYLKAGLAMLGYDESASDENQVMFQELARELEASLGSNPEDESLQSALADCLLQLARFQFTDRKPTERNKDLVSDQEASAVAAWLDRSSELLEGLVTNHPENEQLASRAGAVRAAMENLPSEDDSDGTEGGARNFRERIEQLKAAASISSKWDTTEGLLRFDLVLPTLAENAAGTDMQAIAEHLRALDRGDLPPAGLVRAFADLTVLHNKKNSAVELALMENWPATAREFYYAVLGIRLVDFE